jgi:hypothetical protein
MRLVFLKSCWLFLIIKSMSVVKLCLLFIPISITLGGPDFRDSLIDLIAALPYCGPPPIRRKIQM